MCAVNPVQIPFWFGWSTVLFTKKVLLPKADNYNSYILGIGIGTFIGNCIFIFGGQLIAAKINNNQDILSWVIGGIFTVTAIIQIWRLLFKKRNIMEQLEHPEEVTHGLEEKIIHHENT